MGIQVIKQIDKETIHVYSFGTFSFPYIILTGMAIKTKTSKQRRWRVVKFWDTYNKRDSTLEEPKLTDDIIKLATDTLVESLIFKTFSEYKSI